jgi:hypothetical protein
MTAVLTVDMLQMTAMRLKGSRDAGNAAAVEKGKNHGIYWASQVADYDELSRLARRCELHGIDDVAEDLFASVRGIDSCRVCEDCQTQFWDELFDDDAATAQDDRFMREGYVKGALEVWSAVGELDDNLRSHKCDTIPRSISELELTCPMV